MRLDLIAITLYLRQIVQGIDARSLTGGDDRRDAISRIGSGLGFIEEGIFPMADVAVK